MKFRFPINYGATRAGKKKAADAAENAAKIAEESGSGFGLNWGTALSVGFGISDYVDARDEGASPVEALGSAAMGFVLPELVGGLAYAGFQLASTGVQMGVEGYQNVSTTLRQMDRDNRKQTPFGGYTFVDSPQIYTMRQAGLALAQQSKYNLQQTMMGNEAKYMHR